MPVPIKGAGVFYIVISTSTMNIFFLKRNTNNISIKGVEKVDRAGHCKIVKRV